MPKKIPTYSELLKWRQPILIEGLTYILYFSFDKLTDRWIFRIHNEDDEVLQDDTRIVTDWPLIQTVDSRLPRGQILAIRLDDDPKNQDPNLYDFGLPGEEAKCILMYFREDEFPEDQVSYDYLQLVPII